MVMNERKKHCRKVYLGCKKTQPDKVYAIKAMKKDDMVQKNMIQQGNLLIL